MSCYFTLFYCLSDLSRAECDIISLYFMCCSVNGSVCLVWSVFLNCLVKQFAICLVKQFTICLGVVAILLLNVKKAFSVGGGALLDGQCMIFQIMCVFCL